MQFYLEITLSFTDVGKSCPSSYFLMSQIYLLELFTKFLNLQYFQMFQYL